MKFNRLFLLLLLLPLLVLWGCEGEQGPPGADGQDGTDGQDGQDGQAGTVTCLECHNTDLQNSISLQYARSQHALGEYVDYAGGRASCARCHSGNGYREYMETGGVDGDIMQPSPFLCADCHNVHESFEVTDYALRGADQFVWVYNGETHDFGNNSNVCGNCHQSRRPEPLVDAPGDTYDITSVHYGPHHGAMSNVLAGEGFAEIEGSTAYPATNIHLNAGATCVTCHMGDYADGAGGHTWWPNIDACQNCHTTADFDYGGVQTEVQGLLDDLQDLLESQGVIEQIDDEGVLVWEPIVGTHTMTQARAYFNWIGLTEDRSLGVHNPRYVVALLENSIEAITPTP